MDALPDAFVRNMQGNALVPETEGLAVAVSGGRDSMVLLDLLLRNGYAPTVLHCNFNLRGEASDGDEALVREVAAAHQLSFFAEHFDTEGYAAQQGISTQMAARELRYNWFEDCRARGLFNTLLLAHHLDDQLETFLLNFLRGTGIKGLGGMPRQQGYLYRPLLDVPQAAIARYQADMGVPFREDASNASDDYQRNYLRHHVLPHLYALQPALAAVAQRNFAHLEQDVLLHQAQLQLLQARYCSDDEDGTWSINRAIQRDWPQATETLLWAWLHPLGLDAEQLRQLLAAKTGALLPLSKGGAVLVLAEVWKVQTGQSTPALQLEWPAETPTLPLPDGRTLKQAHHTMIPTPLPKGAQEIWTDARALVYPLTVRNWQAGDRFQPLGMAGTQKLQDFFTNQKIDRLQRAKTPLLVNGDGRIIWVLGHRLDGRFALREDTREVVRFVVG